MSPFARIFVSAAAVLALHSAAAEQIQSAPQAQTFRSGVTLVPLDIRVVDNAGRPVVDLKEADFSILEGGVPQPIRHFSTQRFTADPKAPALSPDFRTGQTPELRTENRRIFLVVLGRGRHQAVSRYVDALADFVETRIHPQDQVAVLAWNRATDFTADKKLVRDLIGRYRDSAQRIEHELSQWFRGLQALYGSKNIPAHIQKQIDAVFAEASALRPRPLAPASITDATRLDDDVRRTADNLLRVREIEDRLKAGFRTMVDPVAERAGGLGFDEYMTRMTETIHDVGNLYAGIGYLRFIEGEKHLVLLTEKGVSLPDQDGNRSLARVAADARIALDFIQTGGVTGTPPPTSLASAQSNFLATSSATFGLLDLRVMAERSGGQVVAFKTGEDSFRRLEEGIAFQYLLGYAPANPARDGTFRKVSVKVNRPNVRVIVREGYFAVDTPVILDRREMVTFNRIRAAAEYFDAVDHIKLTLGKPVVTGDSLSVEVTTNVSRLRFTESSGFHEATLDVALYVGDDKDKPIGEIRQRVELRLDAAAFAQAVKQGHTFRLTAPVKGQARSIKVIVYDYGADLLGSAIARVGR